MTRSIDATLEAALPTAAGTFIAKLQFKRAATSETITVIKAFEINEGRLTAWVKIPKAYKPTAVNPQPLNDTIFQISRGLNILGTDYYFASSWFVLMEIENSDADIIYHGHLFKSVRYTTAGDVAANTVISNVLANSYVSGLSYSNTITYPSSVEWWKTIKFYPAGRTLVLQNIQSFNSILTQKYILNLVDTGSNTLAPHDNGQINQYEPFTPVITPITTVVELYFSQRELKSKYYIWRDEASTVHTSGSNTRPQHNLGYIESTVTPFALDEFSASKGRAMLAPPDLRLTVQDYVRLTSPAGTIFEDFFRIKETFDPSKKIPWFQTLESMSLLANTEGGPMPSTIEAAAPYTPLNVTNFDKVLSANDNNIQAAMETIDDHNHTATDLATTLNALSEKTDPEGSDRFYIGDSAASFALKRLSYTNLYTDIQNSLIADNTWIPVNGWITRSETWTRTGNHTFTVSGDLAATFRKGTKVRYKDGGSFEYGVVASSSHAAGTTTVNLIPNTDYAMAAVTITDTYISFIDNPEAFPQWFNYTTTPSRSGPGDYTNLPTINLAKWRAAGKICWYEIQAQMNATPGGAGYQRYTAPVTNANRATGNGMNLNNAYGLVVFVEVASPEIRVFKYDSSVDVTASEIYFVNGSYEF